MRMRIDGQAIAKKMFASLSSKGVAPTLAVIQVGDDPASSAYIRQKQKAADAIGANIVLSRQPSAVSRQQLQEIIEKFNKDSSVHGIIVQRPLPVELQAASILPSKDVDGFLPDSPYKVPVAAAVLKILKEMHQNALRFNPVLDRVKPFANWLRRKSITVIGRGETAGKPIAETLRKHGVNPIVVHSQTSNPDAVIKAADVVISCVGKPNVVRRNNVKRGAVLISVGIGRDSAGKLHGDYEENEIKDVASFYTPTPGGVGPVNVACLMGNLVHAAQKQL